MSKAPMTVLQFKEWSIRLEEGRTRKTAATTVEKASRLLVNRRGVRRARSMYLMPVKAEPGPAAQLANATMKEAWRRGIPVIATVEPEEIGERVRLALLFDPGVEADPLSSAERAYLLAICTAQADRLDKGGIAALSVPVVI